MGRKSGKRNAKIEPRDTCSSSILRASVEALGWRLRESAARVREAEEALGRGQSEHALERLLDAEPLLFDLDRLLAASLILVRESRADRPSTV